MSICTFKKKRTQQSAKEAECSYLSLKEKNILIKYLDNKNEIVESELLEVLRTVEAI